ncbi:hypothetical protein MmiEs2_08710 [Methanimicrococcus stummii]|uniref:Uncharacterized protein n=1 Tax=Methanimicrococcus stummii TaxID=3028294 RepID=A0AA96VB60_9EURY|nr:hypothetical protein [Methanimicrococcus sp. Es2]WNY28668.1 hypothetical protein MmiEs2_08710 [Methanimicrococcus sp. Es2]
MLSYLNNELAVLTGGIALKTIAVLFFLIALKYLVEKLAQANPAFTDADQFFDKNYLPIGFAVIAISFVHWMCSAGSVETLGFMPFFIGFIGIAVCLIAAGSYYSGKTTPFQIIGRKLKTKIAFKNEKRKSKTKTKTPRRNRIQKMKKTFL